MFGIKKLEKRVSLLEVEVWKLKNPPKYSAGQKTKYGKFQYATLIEEDRGKYTHRRWEYLFYDGKTIVKILG
jgi:hypothetical protein